MQKGKETVLITGATSGIGKELALLFAAEGNHLVITGRHEETLAGTASELRDEGASSVQIFKCDLSIAGSARQLYDNVKKAGIGISILVNDAGVGQHGFFKDIPIEKDLEIINLNIISLVTL